MKECGIFLLSESTTWATDWVHPATSSCRLFYQKIFSLHFFPSFALFRRWRFLVEIHYENKSAVEQLSCFSEIGSIAIQIISEDSMQNIYVCCTRRESPSALAVICTVITQLITSRSAIIWNLWALPKTLLPYPICENIK